MELLIELEMLSIGVCLERAGGREGEGEEGREGGREGGRGRRGEGREGGWRRLVGESRRRRDQATSSRAALIPGNPKSVLST